MRKTDHSEASPYSLLFRSAPLLISRGIVIALLQFVAKRVIYAQVDESLSAAYGIYSAIEGLIFLLIFRGLRIVSATTAHLHAKEKNDPAFDPLEMGKLYRQGVLLGFVLLAPSLLLCVSAPLLFQLTRQSKDVIAESPRYFFYGFLGYFGDMLYRSRARVDVGRSQPIYPLMGDIVESVIDAAGTYVLVDGKYGFPNMGVSGGAAAYAAGAWITAIGYNLRSYYHSDFKKYQLYQFSIDECKTLFFSPDFKKILFGGLHIACKYSIVYLTLALTTFLCGLEGPGAVVGLQAAGAYSNVVILPIGGFSEAASVVIGRLFKNNWQSARAIGNFAITASCVFACLCGALLFYFVHPIARLFIKNNMNEKDLNTVENFLYVQAIAEVINSVGNVGASALSGCLKTRFPFLLSVAFIFILNSLLTAGAHFIFRLDSAKMYCVQLIGFALTSIGVMSCWHKLDHAHANQAGLWNRSAESPRHATVNDLLPGMEPNALRV